MTETQLDDLITAANEEKELRKAGVLPSYKKPRLDVRLGPRDDLVLDHLDTMRAATTLQVAQLEFPGRKNPLSVTYAEQRLYRLRKAGYVESIPNALAPVSGLKGTTTVWVLTKEGFKLLRGPGSEEKPPGPLRGKDLRHLISVNEVYVLLHELLRLVPGYDPSCWRWTGEPTCHRLYGGTPSKPAKRRAGRWEGPALKPDAEIVLFDETVVFLERQTGRAQEKPGKIHDKVFNYHRYENSLERQWDKRLQVVLWACDAQRDIKAVEEAKKNHPTKTLRQLDLDENSRKRMPVGYGLPLEVAEHIRDFVARKVGRRTP